MKNNESYSTSTLLKRLSSNWRLGQRRSTQRLFIASLLASGLSLAPLIKAQAATPILEYRFNETGVKALSSGADSTPVVLRTAAAGEPIDMHSPNGGGVSGKPGDRAMNNTASSRMGKGDNSDNAGRIANQSDLSAIDNLASFTLQGWFKTVPGQTIKDFARLFDNHSDKVSPQGGFELYGGQLINNASASPGSLSLLVNGTPVSTTTAAYPEQNTWVFFAVSYDGTKKTNNVKFYKGTKSSAVKLVNTLTLAKGVLNSEPTGLSIGNRDRRPLDSTQVRDRPFDGYLDNMRIFGAKSGSGGVLSLVELETWRTGDVLNQPPAND